MHSVQHRLEKVTLQARQLDLALESVLRRLDQAFGGSVVSLMPFCSTGTGK